MDQDRLNENISQDEDASLIKNLVDKATGPGDFNRLNDEDVDGVNVTVFLKLHILYVHVPQFLNAQNAAKLENDPNWIDRGLGWW